MIDVKHHCYISGTGRAGTSFLVSLLTHLGVDTGFTPESLQLHEYARAGLEISPRRLDGPYLIKSPHLCDLIEEILASPHVVVDNVVIPIRDLQAAAASRRHVQTKAAGAAPGARTPGGLWETQDPAAQEGVLLHKLYNLIHALVAHDIPMTFLHYPRLVLDADYTFHKLSFLFPAVPMGRFRDVFAQVSRPEWVHQFSPEDTWDRGITQSKTPG